MTEAWHVVRTLRAMEVLAVRPQSAPELAASLGMHARTARRILKRLESEGYVTVGRDRRRRYRPTMRIVALAAQVIERAELTKVAVRHVRALCEASGEDCHLGVPSHLSVFCLVHAAAHPASGCRPQLRELVPCHCTAAGKALLAWRQPWREAVLTQTLASFTERTATGPEWLRKEAARTVARGYSIEDREFQQHTRALAAPVFSDTDDAVAALALVAPAARLSADRYGELGEAVMRAARALSGELRSDT
jgi:IclR family transcriptional regulator, KDG regulon repressor